MAFVVVPRVQRSSNGGQAFNQLGMGIDNMMKGISEGRDYRRMQAADKDGKPFSDIEFSSNMYRGMQADALAKQRFEAEQRENERREIAEQQRQRNVDLQTYNQFLQGPPIYQSGQGEPLWRHPESYGPGEWFNMNANQLQTPLGTELFAKQLTQKPESPYGEKPWWVENSTEEQRRQYVENQVSPKEYITYETATLTGDNPLKLPEGTIIQKGSNGSTNIVYKPDDTMPPEYKRDIEHAAKAIQSTNDPKMKHRIFQDISTRYPYKSVELKRILLQSPGLNEILAELMVAGLTNENK